MKRGFKKYSLWMIIVIIILNSGVFTYAQKEAGLPSGLAKQEVHTTIEAYIKEHQDTTAGVAISVFDDQDAIYRGYHGYGDIEKQVGIDENTVFEWGSATKILVWVSVFQLWEQGKIDLDEDIRTYLPEKFLTKSNQNEKITMLSLMHHDAGWQDVIVDLFVEDIQNIEGLKEALQKTEPEQIYPVGKVKAYSNWGTSLAGYTVEEITRQEFYKYVRENIFTPLNMKNTALLPDLSDNLWVKEKRQEIQGYTSDKKLIKKNFYHVPLYPSGMATGTMKDFERFGKGLIEASGSRKLFQEKDTLNKFLNPTLYYGKSKYARNSNGLWFTEYGVPVLGHGGNTAAFSSNILLDPISKTCVIVMTNQKYEEIYNYEMMELIFGEFRPVSSNGLLPSEIKMDGTYQNARTILNGFGKLYSFMTRMKIKEDSMGEIKAVLGGKSYEVYQFEPSLYNLGKTLLHVHKDKDEKILLSGSYGDYYRIDQSKVIIEYILLILAVLALCYSIIMLVVELVKTIRSKKNKKPLIKTSLRKYYLFNLGEIILVFLNVGMLAFKVLNYSVIDSIRPHAYISLIFMITLAGYFVWLIFYLIRNKCEEKVEIPYVLTGIAGLIISLNIYYWQLYYP